MMDTDYIGRLCRLAFAAVAAAAAAALAGCTDDGGVSAPDVRPSDFLAFTADIRSRETSSVGRGSTANLETEVEEWALPAVSGDGAGAAARGELTTILNNIKAGVVGFTYDTYDPDEVKMPLVPPSPDTVNVIALIFRGDELQDVGTPLRWNAVRGQHLDIYAYAPRTEIGITADPAVDPVLSVDPVDAPSLSYELRGSVAIADHEDIIVSKWKSPETGEYRNKTIHLTFDHALTAIRFKVGFACTVKSVSIEGVYDSGTYHFSNDAWDTTGASTTNYTVSFGESGTSFKKGDPLTDGENTMILLPQTLPGDAKIVLTCTDKVYTAEIGGKSWDPGKVITYTLYEDKAPETIYFDLALADVVINGKTKSYSGKVDKGAGPVNVTGEHKDGNYYYVYQSTEANRADIWKDGVCTPPTYDEITVDGRPWRDFITNNPDVESVIENWDINHETLVNAAGRSGTQHWIKITNNVTSELTIDNIYSTYQDNSPTTRTTAGIVFMPIRDNRNVKNAKVTVKMIGDSRVGAVHYSNWKDNGNEIIFEGPGSLTVADVNGVMKGTKEEPNYCGLTPEEGKGYWSNHWSSAIGGNDSSEEMSYGIVINSGTIFAGTTKAENCTAIGGGGNVYGGVTINGGTVTAVATTTGTAIGGGIGYGSPGGLGNVNITGGNIYAYNHANRWKCPSSAIGGAGSINSTAVGESIVNISGGYVYAESALGPGIGAGSSYSLQGGSVKIMISGGEVIAKTRAAGSVSIGGGTAHSKGFETEDGKEPSSGYDGGYAHVTISGNPIIRTGSVGGGGTGDSKGHIGNATINISGGDIQAQFILAAGTTTGQTPTFTMTGGTIRKSDTADEEYLHMQENGGAVYLENGSVEIIGGEIRDCSAEKGGAIYIEGKQNYSSNTSFTMTGGTIQDNEAALDGGAVYIIDGTVALKGGTIDDNLATMGNGGGIFIQRGSLTVDGATIRNNSAEGFEMREANGGGIYVYSLLERVKVDLISGSITGNTADHRGGGVCVDVQDSKQIADVTIGTPGGGDGGIQITGNHALVQGGGLFARGTNAHIIINSGTILDNTVSQYVPNQDVANEFGSVTLNGGRVTHCVVTFDANGGMFDGTDADTVTQNIVTSTNSMLNAPAVRRMGFDFVGWNTKANGNGDEYSDKQTMNINTNITLYAQWKITVTP